MQLTYKNMKGDRHLNRTGSRNLEGRGNTRLLVREGERYALRYHETDVVTFHPNGHLELRTGGWPTVTTKERMNRALQAAGWWLWTDRGTWWLSAKLWDRENRFLFAEGVHVSARMTKPQYNGARRPNLKARAKLKARIKAFAALCAKDLPLPEPSGGDCWYCALRVESPEKDKGKTLGETTSTSHLDSHMREAYVVPSLVLRALELYGCQAAIWGTFDPREGAKYFRDIARHDVPRAVRRYMYRQYGLPA